MRLRAKSLSKAFGNTAALKDASVEFFAGEIHAVCGENGAGKSTLLKLVCGVEPMDRGSVVIDDVTYDGLSVERAQSLGIMMVHQHLALIGSMSAIENTILLFPGIHFERAREQLTRACATLGYSVPLDVPTETLSLAERQRVEIARALSGKARLLVLDEPTAVLAPTEASELYGVLERLKEQGIGIVVVTHKLAEVASFADRVTVLRKGIVVHSELRARGSSMDAIVAAVMGENANASLKDEKSELPSAAEGAPLLTLSRLKRQPALLDVSLDLHAGEIVGIAGVEGNGQRELVSILGEATKKAIEGVSKHAALSIVYEDRHEDGLVLPATILDNVVLGSHAEFGTHGLLNLDQLRAEATKRLERLGVRMDVDAKASTLSGGNQQKVVLARALAGLGERGVLVLAHPTRGIDVGASKSIHREILRAAATGHAVLVISADLDELRTLSHRILVMLRGAIVGAFEPDATDDQLGRAMLGAA